MRSSKARAVCSFAMALSMEHSGLISDFLFWTRTDYILQLLI